MQLCFCSSGMSVLCFLYSSCIGPLDIPWQTGRVPRRFLIPSEQSPDGVGRVPASFKISGLRIPSQLESAALLDNIWLLSVSVYRLGSGVLQTPGPVLGQSGKTTCGCGCSLGGSNEFFQKLAWSRTNPECPPRTSLRRVFSSPARFPTYA